MANLSPKAKGVALSAVLASTAVVAYASNEISNKDAEQSVDTANLIVEKISKDRVKISVDNVENAVKAFQLSLKIDGNVEFKDDDINWLTTIGGNEEKNTDKPVETDYVLSQDKKEIDIFVASNSELDKKGRVLEICEIDLKQTGLKSNSSYKIIPNTKDGKIAYKSVDINNIQIEEANMTFADTVLSLNTAPTITLKPSESEDVTVDVDNKIIKVKEGYDFNANAKSFIEVSDEDEEISVDKNVAVTDVNTSQSGTYNVEYTVTDGDGETTKLNVSVLVEPEVWKEAPTITGVPKDKLEVFAGDIFDPLMPDGKTKITASDAKGNSLEVEYTKDFDVNSPGEHTITYTAKDRFNNTVSNVMTLNVLQNEAPRIIGADDIVINKGTEFNPKDGIEVEDDDPKVTIDNLEVIGNINTSIAKVYTLTYKVSDGKNTTTKVRKVTVNDAPSINGDLSYIILKNGQQLNENDILGRIQVSDDLDEVITATVDKSGLNTSQDGTYKVKISATDSKGLKTEKEVTVIVTSKSVIDLPESGNGLSKEESIKKEVVEESAISKINEELSKLTKDYNVESTKSNVLGDIVYSIKVSSKPVAFRNNTEEWFVDITVPKSIEESSGGIVITQHEAVKVSSIKITGNDGEMKKGDTIELNAVVGPEDAENKKLLWSSTNPDVIKITPSDDSQSVIVEALKNGTSTIRAVAIDGSEVFDETIVQVGEPPKEDTEKPVFDYKGKTDIKIANGMKFEIPVVTASDNVDTGLEVTTTILDSSDKIIENIDTTVAGKYKIKYETIDKAGNKAELIINIEVNKAITGVVVGSGDATTEEKALVMESTNVDGLKELVSEIKKDFDAEIVGKPAIDNNKGTATYTIKLSKKQGLISRLFNLNKNTEVYYIKVSVKNIAEFTDILDEFNKDGSTTNPPEIPETPETSVTQLIGQERFETAVKISKEGWNTADTVIIVNGNNKNLVDGLTATPLASIKNAPILLSNNNELPKETIDEIKRLKASEVIVIGGTDAVPQSIVDIVKSTNKNINVQRIGGLTRYETALKIAKEIDKTNDITKVYIGAGDGEADSLSISPIAGKEKAPIILTEKDGLDEQTYEYLKSENIEDGYFIGGTHRISDKAISQVDKIVSKDISKNRIAGIDRKETNAKVIEKFFTSTQLNGVAVAKDDELIDALSVGPLAAKKDMPVVLATNDLNKSQEQVLNNKKSPKIYEAGGGIKSTVIDKLKQLVDNKK